MDENTLKRLVFIKYIFDIGMDQTRKNSPFNAVSLLNFHDSLEMFLKLVIEYNKLTINLNKSIPEILNELDLYIKTIDNSKSLIQIDNAKKLNNLRNKLKHDGSIPAPIEIELIRTSIYDFYIENTPILLGISFTNLTIAQLINNIELKNLLELSIENFKKNLIEDSFFNLGVAFKKTINLFNDLVDKSSFNLKSSILPYFHSVETDFDTYVIDSIKEIDQRILKIEEFFILQFIEIDISNYLKFNYFIPDIYYHNQNFFINKINYKKKNLYNNNPPNEEEFQFCLNFVVNSIIKFEEFESNNGKILPKIRKVSSLAKFFV